MKSLCFLLFCALAAVAHATPKQVTPAASHAQAQAAALALAGSLSVSGATGGAATASATVQPGAVVSNPSATATVAPGAAQGGAASATGIASGGIGVNVERSAPSTYATAPVQVRNCRLGIGAGGSNVTGSFSAAIVIGNDQTCLSGAQIEMMTAANARAAAVGAPPPFTVTDYVRSACAVEGMGEAEACKSGNNSPRAAGVSCGIMRIPFFLTNRKLLQIIMPKLDQLTADVQSVASVAASAATLLHGLKAQLDAAIQANNDGDDGAALADLSKSLEESRDKLAEAIAANTPAAAEPAAPAAPLGGTEAPVTVNPSTVSTEGSPTATSDGATDAPKGV